MHIGIEAVQLPGDRRGIGRYVRRVLGGMLAHEPSLTCTLFARDPAGRAALAFEREQWPVASARARIEVATIRALRRTPMDVCWYPWNVIRWRPPAVPVVLTVHDLVPMLFAESWWRRVYVAPRARRLFAASFARADAVLANSAFTAAEVARVFGPLRAPVTVTPLAANDFPYLADPVAQSRAAALTGDGPYVLAVGAADARKNLALALEAGARLAARGTPMRVVVIGPGRKLARLLAPLLADGAAPWLVAPGFVDDAVLAALYARATALVFPSRYEGFGLPVLEAMAAGCPVITTRGGALPEVAGDAARYVDPDDPAALADAIAELAGDADARARLTEAGRARAKQFTWIETVRRTLEVLRQVGQRPRQDSNL